METFDLKTLQVDAPMMVPLSEGDEDMIRIAFSGLLYKDRLYNEAKIQKPNTIQEPDSLSYKYLFSIILDSCPFEAFNPNSWEEILLKLEEIKQLDKSLSSVKVDPSILQKKCVTARELLKLLCIGEDEEAYREVVQLEDLLKSKMKDDPKPFLNQDPVCQALRKVMALFIDKIEGKKNFKSLYWLSRSLKYYSSINLNKELASNMIDEINKLAGLFGKNIAHIIGDDNEQRAYSYLTGRFQGQLKESTKLGSFGVFFKKTEANVKTWLKFITDDVEEALALRYQENYPTFEEITETKSNKLQDQDSTVASLPKSVLRNREEFKSESSATNDRKKQYEKKKADNVINFSDKVEMLLESILNLKSFLFQSPQKVNWQLVQDLTTLYQENSKMSKDPEGSLERQIIHKNIVIGNLNLIFENGVHLCVPIHQNNSSLFHSKLAKSWSAAYIRDFTCSRILHYAIQEKKVLSEMNLNEGHGEKALLAFIIEKLESIIGLIEDKVQDALTTNSLTTKNLAQMNLDIYTTNELCETCQILLTHSLPQIYERIMESLKTKFGIQDISTKKTLVKRVAYSQHRRSRRNFANVWNSDLFLCKEPISFLNADFLEKILSLPDLTAKNRAYALAKRTYFVSIPENQEAFTFYEQKIQSFERATANTMNEM